MLTYVKHFNDFNNSIDFSLLRTSKEKIEFTSNLIKQDSFDTVAIITSSGTISDILAEAWRLTNTIDEPWFKNQNISVAEKYQNSCRSSSIGDIIVIGNDTYIIDTIGFISINQAFAESNINKLKGI